MVSSFVVPSFAFGVFLSNICFAFSDDSDSSSKQKEEKGEGSNI